MKRQLATSLCTFALLTSLQPAAQADELADFLRSLVGPIMPGNNEGPAPANPGPGDALIAEVSGQHFSAQAPQLDPAVQPQWAIVVFGSALDKDGGVPQALSSRLEKALVVANTNPGATVVVAGGKPQAGVTEAQAMKRWLVEHGVGEERIVTEEQSTDTVGNAKNVAPILSNGGKNGAILITAGSHLRRATVDFRMATGSAYNTISVPAEDKDVTPPVPKWEKTAMERDLKQFS